MLSIAEFVTCSEDRTLKVWTISEGNPIQTIPLPAQSLWKVIVLIVSNSVIIFIV